MSDLRIYFKVKKVTVIRKRIMTKFFFYKRVYFKVKTVTVKMLWVLVTGRDIAFSLSYWRFVHSDNWQRKRLVHSRYRVKGWQVPMIVLS